MKRWFFLLALLSGSLAFGQSDECGTHLSKRQKQLLKDFRPSQNKNSRQYETPVREVGIVAHLVRRDDGSGGLTLTQLNAAIGIVNDYYVNANLHFFVGEINEINSTKYFDFNTVDEPALGLKYDANNAINIYFVNSVADHLGTYCGYAYFPGGPDRILMDNSCTINGSTLAHEIGHYFTLIHTHGNNNNELTDELVDGSNCANAGDQICDTPADPHLSFNNVNTSCVYTGSVRDANNDLFVPDPDNLMSYSRKECRTVFTAQQYSRMDQAYDVYRSYLVSKPVTADFIQNVSKVCTGVGVQYADKSIGEDTRQWYFEGGTPETSTDQNPLVVYQNAGEFDVRLIVDGPKGDPDTLLMPNAINVTAPPTSNLIKTAVGFEVTSGYSILNPDQGMTFQRSTAASTKGSYSLFMNFYNYETRGQEDYLVLAALDNTFSTSYTLAFDYAYAYYNQELSDGLSIVYKADCETEWTTLWSASGAGLATASQQATPFVPTKAQWRPKSIAVNLPHDISVYELAFKTTNGYGNNLYIDNIRLNPQFETEVSVESCVGAGDAVLAVNIEGTEAYEYSVDGVTFVGSNEFIGLEGGTYTVIVRDSKSRTLSKEVELPAAHLNIELHHPTCFDDGDGSAQFDVTGSDEYEYEVGGILLESKQISGLGAGEYEVLVRKIANGCEYREFFTIEQPNEMTLDLQVTSPICADESGTIEVDAHGGTGSYTYIVNDESFSSPMLSVPAGDYGITVMDENGCEVSTEGTLVAPDPIQLTYELANFDCANDDGLVTLQATGGVGDLGFLVDDTQLDSNSMVITRAGTYSLTAVDANGCSYTEQVTFEPVYPTPGVPVITRSNGMLHIEETDFDITWYLDGELVEGADTESIEYQMGTYQVSLSNPGGFCEVFSEEHVVFILGDDLFDNIAVAPNPIRDRLEVKLPLALANHPVQIDVFTLSGMRVHSGAEVSILANWEKGVYLVYINLGERSEVRRVIKN